MARKPKKDDDKPADDGGKEHKGGWREVLARYGLTEQDVVGKEAQNGLKFVRIDGLEVSTERDCFLLHGNEGKVVAIVPAPNQKFAIGGPVAPELVMEPDVRAAPWSSSASARRRPRAMASASSTCASR